VIYPLERHFRFLALLLVAPSLLFQAGAAGAATLHRDDFTPAGTSGWGGGGAGGQTVQRVGTGGPAGAGDAYLQFQSPGANLAVHNALPEWTGNFNAVSAARITLDARNTIGSEPIALRLVLFGPTSTGNRWTSTLATTIAADNVWRPYTFSLAAADLTQVLGTGAHNELLSGVVQVMFRHDPDPPSSGGEPVLATLELDNIRLRAARALGDYNDDGLISAADYSVWQTSFGSAAPNFADGNTNGVVDAADYTVWRDALPGVPAASVPESSALILAASALILLGGRRIGRIVAVTFYDTQPRETV